MVTVSSYSKKAARGHPIFVPTIKFNYSRLGNIVDPLASASHCGVPQATSKQLSCTFARLIRADAEYVESWQGTTSIGDDRNTFRLESMVDDVGLVLLTNTGHPLLIHARERPQAVRDSRLTVELRILIPNFALAVR